MSNYNVVPANEIQTNTETLTLSKEKILRIIYDAVKCKVMPCVINAPKDTPKELMEEIIAAGYRVEVSPWNKEKDQWRVFWDFAAYRTVEKDQDDTKTYLDVYEK
ncbi:hypothetical protein [Eubacterium oxidoreducens]|uniref:Uncharacterized protein n=1 Tax=Eubacterium oxidoreducens TaxID=1732 RepID=A0A1G6AWH8_EUBOX|nr:hypothetical protein [Eubacterium oxidoreducens]SDB12757.1 hypothetical protein SAMN02910417_00974 [Eubacterium oxidoreducens]